MFERRKYERLFLFTHNHVFTQAEKDDLNPVEISWVEKHRFRKFPLDFLDLTQYPFIFSPNYEHYLDLSDDHLSFVIRATFKRRWTNDKKERIVCRIPEEFMSGKDEPAIDVARRFMWLTDTVFKIINHQGIERILDIQFFRDSGFNFIPIYDKTICTKTHYMWDPLVLKTAQYNLSDCLSTLKQRYQQYKSSFNLRRVRNPKETRHDLYSDIFHVDFTSNNCQSRYETDMSFSFLHWCLMEQLKAGKLQVKNLDSEIIE